MFNLKINKMFKKSIKLMAIFFVSTMLLTSCYSYTSIVGKGAQGIAKRQNGIIMLFMVWLL